MEINTLEDLCKALKERVEFFDKVAFEDRICSSKSSDFSLIFKAITPYYLLSSSYIRLAADLARSFAKVSSFDGCCAQTP